MLINFQKEQYLINVVLGENKILKAVLSFNDLVFSLLLVIWLNIIISRIDLSILILQCVLVDTSVVHAVGFVLQIA